jgi:hypothetical protein
MVRWPAGLHPQGAKRNTNMLQWRPGFLDSGQQPITAVPITRYGGKISSVPLTGGQAQGTIPGYPAGSGSASSPGAFTVIASTTVPVAGTYTIAWTVSLAGTLSGTETNNFHLDVNGARIATSVNADTAGSYPQTPVTYTFNAGDQIEVYNVNAGTANSVYGASIPAAGGSLTLQVGPQGLGTVWYPVSVVLSTTTGALDTSTALVYLGPSATPATLQGTLFSGNGTTALAIPSMSPGQTIIVNWQNGHPGDTAAFNITGTMDALSTR